MPAGFFARSMVPLPPRGCGVLSPRLPGPPPCRGALPGSPYALGQPVGRQGRGLRVLCGLPLRRLAGEGGGCGREAQRPSSAGSGGAGAPPPSTRGEVGEEAATAPPRRLLGIPRRGGLRRGHPVTEWLAASRRPRCRGRREVLLDEVKKGSETCLLEVWAFWVEGFICSRIASETIYGFVCRLPSFLKAELSV